MKFQLIWLTALLLLAGGCAHTRSRDEVAADQAWQVLPPVIDALTGPAALLLTNVDGWQGQITLTLATEAGPSRRVTGQLAESKGRIYFASAPVSKSLAGRFAIIWDTGRNQGWVMSEALQGAAAMSQTNHFTVSQREPAAGGGENRAGHPVQNVVVTLVGSAGQTVKYQVAQAPDLALLALQIQPQAGPEQVAISVSQIQTTAPAEGMFDAPDDFTKYASVAALLDELISRQRTVFHDGDEYHPPAGALDQIGSQSRFQNNSGYTR